MMMTAATSTGAEPIDVSPPPPPRSRLWRIARALGVLLLSLILFCVLGWSMLAIYYSGLAGASPRGFLSVVFGIAAVASLLFIRPRRFGVLTCFGLFAIVLVWFLSLKPSNDRDWAPDVTALTSCDMDGDKVVIHNVRNIDYRSETDFTPRWEDRTYYLSQLHTLDLMLVYWGSPAIAHAIVSFGFEGDQQLAVSIEARKQKSESYSAIQGFFRQFELMYVFSDERDVVRLRTNYRHEDVYLYRLVLAPAQVRALFLNYLENANSLARRPEFYNALTSNCATNVLENAKASKLPAEMTWRVLLSGYAAEQLYSRHRIDTSMPYEQLVAKSHVNEAAMKADQDPEFSKKIRIGLPSPVQVDAPVKPTLPAANVRQS